MENLTTKRIDRNKSGDQATWNIMVMYQDNGGERSSKLEFRKRYSYSDPVRDVVVLFVTEQFSSCPIVVKRYRVSFTGKVFIKDCMNSFSRRLSDVAKSHVLG